MNWLSKMFTCPVLPEKQYIDTDKIHTVEDLVMTLRGLNILKRKMEINPDMYRFDEFLHLLEDVGKTQKEENE